jgi:hypothetical protein
VFKVLGAASVFVIGAALASILFTGYVEVKRAVSLNTPIETIFEARTTIPDFVAGEIPPVQYDRTIHQAFQGSYSVEVKSIADGVTRCYGSGTSLYEPGETLANPVTLDWYVNGSCATRLVPGQYIVETHYSLEREGLPDRFYDTASNVFSVIPKPAK